jgi:hypothetical protein
MRGRALALLTVVFLGSTPIGGPIIGWICENVGPRAALVVGGAASALTAGWVLVQLRVESDGAEPTGSDEIDERELDVVVELDDHDGTRLLASDQVNPVSTSTS